MGLSAVQEVMRDASSLFGMDIHVANHFATSFDWNIIFRRINEMYDATQEPQPRAKYHAMIEELETTRSTPWNMFVWLATPGNVESHIANMFIALLYPAVDAFEESIHRAKCADNIQRLALAMLLYQHEHGTMPDENWTTQIQKYLDENPEQYFSCSTNPSANGMTTYALVQYGNSDDTVAGSRDLILFVELSEAMPLDKAVVSVDDMLEWKQTKNGHPGGMNVALRNGAVRFVSLYSDSSKAEWRRLLGREEATKAE